MTKKELLENKLSDMLKVYTITSMARILTYLEESWKLEFKCYNTLNEKFQFFIEILETFENANWMVKKSDPMMEIKEALSKVTGITKPIDIVKLFLKIHDLTNVNVDVDIDYETKSESTVNIDMVSMIKK